MTTNDLSEMIAYYESENARFLEILERINTVTLDGKSLAETNNLLFLQWAEAFAGSNFACGVLYALKELAPDRPTLFETPFKKRK